MDTIYRRSRRGAPPDGFLIDGHISRRDASATSAGAPPDGFLIDGHNNDMAQIAASRVAHRLTGFSSMDTSSYASRGIRVLHRRTA